MDEVARNEVIIPVVEVEVHLNASLVAHHVGDSARPLAFVDVALNEVDLLALDVRDHPHFPHVDAIHLLVPVHRHEVLKLVLKLDSLVFGLLLKAKHHQIVGLEVAQQLVQVYVLRLASHVPSESHNFDVFLVLVSLLSEDASVVLMKRVDHQLLGVDLVICFFLLLLGNLHRASYVANDLLLFVLLFFL